MIEHTELPWQGPLSARDCKERNVIDDADGRTLLLIVGITIQSRGERKRVGDALVRICNSHKDLLDVVKPLLEGYRNMAQILQTDFQFQGDQLTQRAEEAIVKAQP